MDEARAKFVLGLSSQLPASAHGLHQLLLTMGASGVSAAGELISRCDALNSCSLQPLSVSLEEATSSIARALFIITDSISYSCSASHGLHLALNALSDVAAENAVSPRQVQLMRFFRCLCSTMVDASQALGVTSYFPDFTGDEKDQELFQRVLKSFTPFPAMEPEAGNWTVAGANVQTDMSAYPLLLQRYTAVPLLLAPSARGIHKQVTEEIIWNNRIMDRPLFNDSFEGIIVQKETENIRKAELTLVSGNPDFHRNLANLVTRFNTYACITLVVRAGFAGVEAYMQVSMPNAIPPVNVDPCPHQAGRYGAAQETASRIVTAGPRSLAGSESSWLLSSGTAPTNVLPESSIPPVLPSDELPPRLPEFRVPDLPLRDEPRPLPQGANPSLNVPPALPSVPGRSTDVPGTGFPETLPGKNHGWSLLTASLKIPQSKYKLPSANASQKVWQNWKLAMLQFDTMWNIEPVQVLNAILLTIDAEDSRINGWFETQNLASLSKRKITMSEFCDYVLRQVICTSTTRKAAWSELDSLYKNIKDISDCHVLAVKIKQLVHLIYPTDTVNVQVEAAPCTHREIIMSLYNLTISLRDSDKRCVVISAWKNYDVYSYATTFNSYLDSNLHLNGTESIRVSSGYITDLFSHLELAHRMHTQVTLSEKSKSNGNDFDNKNHKRKHSVQAFNAEGLARHDSDHAGRKRSAQTNRSNSSPSTRGGRGGRGSSGSRGGGHTSAGRSTGITKASHADPVDEKLAQATFNRIGELFAKSEPEMLLPHLQNLAYPQNKKSITQCRKDLGRGMCVLCLQGKHEPAACHLLRANKANTPAGKMAARFWAKYSKGE